MSSNSEELFGISEYIEDGKGIFGIIKQRFSDFVVNEVSSLGKIVHLTSEEVIPLPSVSHDKVEKPDEITDENVEYLRILSGQKQMKELKPSTFLVKSDSGKDFTVQHIASDKMNELKINVSNITKEKRKLIHNYIKSHFSNLNSSTIDLDNEKFIKITKQENAQKKDRRNCWPKSQSQVNFVLYKENIDTMEAINILAKNLRLKPGMFSYAGTKDRRGKTSQLVSVYQVSPQNIFSAAKSLSKIRVGNFFYSNKGQKLGLANGNHFKIVLREIDASTEELESAANLLKEKGFINYFGTQRFGTSSIATHTVGKALLLNNWKQAVDLILSKRENDSPDMAEAKKIWAESQDASSAYRTLAPFRKASIEGMLLSGLMNSNAKDLVNALNKIPRNVKHMYIHAYQSYVWNRVVSRRIKKYKLQVLPGDLVKKRGKNSECPITQSEKLEDDSPAPDESEMDDEDTSQISENKYFELKDEEIKDFSITDVVMPLPGYKIVYPSNEIKEWYLEVLQADGFSYDSFKQRVKTYSLGGAYRKIVIKPQSLEYACCSYDDPTQPLVQSDVDILNNVDVMKNRLTEGAHRALILEFTLPASCYATMALRELMKMDTSSKFHSSLNNNKNSTQKRHHEGETECKRLKSSS